MTASNALDHLHDERYGDAFDRRNLDHGNWVFTGGRRTQSLAGTWRLTPDIFEEGLRQHWYRQDGTAPDRRTSPWDGHPDEGYPVRIPSCWNLARPEWKHFEGCAWLSRHFRAPRLAAGERLFLRVGAANYDAKVFINGVFLGNHRGGSTPFFVELTGQLVSDNRLDLCLDNSRRPDRVPMHHFDWFNYAGAYREVELIRVPATFVRDFVVRWQDGTVAVEVETSGRARGTAHFAIPELGVALDIQVKAGRGSGRIKAAPRLWSPADPKLYDVTLQFGADRVTDRVGFRTIAARGAQVLLNGAPVRLKGVCVHEDDLHLGKATSDADIRRRFRHARALGCNFLRLAHYPHHERVAQLADEEGMLLWAEIPVYWAIDFANPRTYRDAENQLIELVRRDRNRASVIVWSVGNENADTAERLSFMRRLAATARKWDSTRLVSAACLVNKTKKRIEDRLARHLDVIGINEYYGWYDRDVADLEAICRNSVVGKPIIITEVGAEAPAGRRGRADELFTEDKMEAVYRAQVDAVGRLAMIAGMTPWLLYDFRSERRQNRFQRGFNCKGLIAADKKTRKRAFRVLRDFYARWR